MHDDKTKEKLLKELRKFGNVYLSCLKVGIDKSTFYRWIKKDRKFNKLAKEAIKEGRENICDVAEHALLQNLKEKKMEAIKYALAHNSKRYKDEKKSNVVIFHKKDFPIPEPQKTLEDLIIDDEEQTYIELNKIKEKFEKMGGIPAKTDGSQIELEELGLYEKYIEEWYKKKEQIKTKISTDTADSKSLLDKPEVMPPENHKT